MRTGRIADHKRLAVEQDHVIDTGSIDYAFSGEQDPTVKLVLILQDHKCRWTEALPVRRTGLLRLIFKSDQQEPSILDLEEQQGSC